MTYCFLSLQAHTHLEEALKFLEATASLNSVSHLKRLPVESNLMTLLNSTGCNPNAGNQLEEKPTLPGSQIVARNQEQKCAIVSARKESRPEGKFWYKFITLGWIYKVVERPEEVK